MTSPKIVDIIDNEFPNVIGKAKCLACEHEWQHEAPSNIKEFECPECKKESAIFAGLFFPEAVYSCATCTNQHFYIDENSNAFCGMCGSVYDFQKEQEIPEEIPVEDCLSCNGTGMDFHCHNSVEPSNVGKCKECKGTGEA